MEGRFASLNKRGHPYESGRFVFRDICLTFPLLTSRESWNKSWKIENSGGWRKIRQICLCVICKKLIRPKNLDHELQTNERIEIKYRKIEVTKNVHPPVKNV